VSRRKSSSLGTQLQPGRQTILISATISDIPSYNRLPTGDQGTRVRGQFLKQNAAALIEQLKQPAIQIEYSRDFFQQVIKYDLPLTGAAEALQQFSACIGNADFLWLKHDHPRLPSCPATDIASDLGLCSRQARVRCLRSIELDLVKPGRRETAMGIRSHTATPMAALALGLLFAPPVAIAIDAIINTAASVVSASIGNLGFTSPAMGQSGPLTTKQSDALNAYNRAVGDFEQILRQRRAQINSKQPLPNLPGQALYLARVNMISTYKDLTDALPSKIGRSNKFGVPPAYFDVDKEPLIDEYRALFDILEAPPANAQNSDTPFKDVVDLAIAIARAKGLDATNADLAGRISLGMFFAETNGNQNVGNGRSNKYKGSFQTGTSEDQNGRRKWAAIKPSIAAFDPALIRRDDKEEARAGNLDHRFNHWTAVRDGLMNAHADLLPQVAAIAKILPKPIDQMKFFELIQIIPTPTRSALASGNLVNYRISDPRIMGYLRNNSIFAFGQADRARTSASFREILDAMWLFNAKFERALAKFDEIKGR
jgi:hypothetical protein